MKMRAVAVFTGMLTGVLSVTGLLSAGAYAAGGEGNMSASATETNARVFSLHLGPRGWFTTRPRRGRR